MAEKEEMGRDALRGKRNAECSADQLMRKYETSKGGGSQKAKDNMRARFLYLILKELEKLSANDEIVGLLKEVVNRLKSDAMARGRAAKKGK